MEKAIKKAIEGGWMSKSGYQYAAKDGFAEVRDQAGHYVYDLYWPEITCRPDFWKSLGKACGWDKENVEGFCEVCGEPLPENEKMFRYHGYSTSCPKPPLKIREWKKEWRRFIDHLAEGKDADSFFTNLLK